ncbi:MAG: InlB B-repeat-containing protein [Bacteroidales bacterium]|nr:InlB B-repeat-containing protein [Bacteroidales bacterium]
MILLYKYTEEIFDEDGNSQGFNTEGVIFPNTFFLTPDLEFDWDKYIVIYEGNRYYFGHLIETLEKVPPKEEWLAMPGNSIDLEYYKGVAAEYSDNPTGNTKNVKKMVYKTDGVPKFTIKMRYNDVDNVVQMKTLSESNKEAGSGMNYDEEYTAEQDLTKLYITPFFGVTVDNNTVTVAKTNNTVLVTAFRSTTPAYSDTLKVSDKTAMLNIAYTSDKWNLDVYLYDKNRVLIAQTAAENKSVTVNNSEKKINFVALVFSKTDGSSISGVPITEISQEKIGLTVTEKDTIKLTKHNTDRNDNTIVSYYVSGSTVTLDALQDTETERFLGWYDGETETASQITEIVLDKDTDVWARWQALKYTLTYHNTDGKQNTEAVQCNNGETVLLENLEDIEGYSFVGWFDSSDSEAQKITEITMNNNKHVWAHWEKNDTQNNEQEGD